MVTLVPGGSEVLGTGGRFMEGLDVGSGMEIEQTGVGIEAVDGLRVCNAGLRQPRAAICPELPQINTKNRVFMQHEENGFINARGRNQNRKRRRLLDRWAVGSGCRR